MEGPIGYGRHCKTMLFRHILGGAYAMGFPTQPSAPGLRVGVAAGRFELMPTPRQLCMLALNVTVPKYSAPSELAVAYGTNTLSFKKLSAASTSASVKSGSSG